MNYFNRTNLPFNKKMKNFWDDNGYLVIENFYSDNECDLLINKSEKLINDFNPNSIKSIFDTKNQEQVEDRYFLESGDKIRFFFEDGVFDKKGNLKIRKELAINKIGHALHDLDSIFSNFSSRVSFNSLRYAEKTIRTNAE